MLIYKRVYVLVPLIETRRINSLSEVFKIIPLTFVRTDMNANYSTLRQRIAVSETLTLKDFVFMSELLEIEPVEDGHCLFFENVILL